MAVVLVDGGVGSVGCRDEEVFAGPLCVGRDLRLAHRPEVHQHQRRPPTDVQEGTPLTNSLSLSLPLFLSFFLSFLSSLGFIESLKNGPFSTDKQLLKCVITDSSFKKLFLYFRD